MVHRRFLVPAGLAAFAALLLISAGCREGVLPPFDKNRPPETFFVKVPPDTNERENVPFRYHAFWKGEDPDGMVTTFYWAIDETVAVGHDPVTFEPTATSLWRATPRT